MSNEVAEWEQKMNPSKIFEQMEIEVQNVYLGYGATAAAIVGRAVSIGAAKTALFGFMRGAKCAAPSCMNHGTQADHGRGKTAGFDSINPARNQKATAAIQDAIYGGFLPLCEGHHARITATENTGIWTGKEAVFGPLEATWVIQRNIPL